MRLLLAASALALATAPSGGPPWPGRTEPLVSGADGYHTYRIPSVIKLGNGDLMLFAEGRKLSSSDHGWNDVVAKVSSDNGNSWGPMQVVYSESTTDKQVCIGNPSPVVLSDGRILLVACRNNLEVLMLSGTRGPDAGNSNTTAWGAMAEIKEATLPAWTWVATGPPQAIQLSPSTHGQAGRILVSADHQSAAGPGSHAMYSDDGGRSWALSQNDMAGGDECQAAQLANGSLIMNQRTATAAMRQFSWSHDQGARWSTPTYAPFAFSGKYAGGDCEGSTIATSGRSGHDRLLFSTPFAPGRENMTVWSSNTAGMSWELLHVVDPGPSAYSAMVELNSTHFGIFWESKNYGAISFLPLPYD